METELKMDWGTISAGVERMVLNPELGSIWYLSPTLAGKSPAV